MQGNWLRRGLWAAATGVMLALAGCGSGSIEAQFVPTRVVSFGDATADLGQAGTRYTVNDGSANIWTQQVAAGFGYIIGPTSVAGGTSYAQAHARINTVPDAVGNASTPTVDQQVSRFLASGGFQTNDLVLMSAGTSDLIVEAQRVITGAQTATAANENARAAGRAFANLVRRMVQAGALHIGVAGVYNLGKTPWALQTNQVALMQQLSSAFNDEFLVAIVDLGANVLYIDAALEYNLFVGFPSSFLLNNVVDLACTSVDPGVGIGTGTGQVNSALCTPATLVSSAAATTFLWADRVYPGPTAQRYFGDYAFSRIRGRW